MYHSDLLPDLEILETRRLTAKKKFIQAIIIVVALNLIFLFVAGSFGLNLIFSLMFLVLSGIFGFFSWYIKYFRGYQAGFKQTIIPKIVAFIDQNLQYDEAGRLRMNLVLSGYLSKKLLTRLLRWQIQPTGRRMEYILPWLVLS